MRYAVFFTPPPDHPLTRKAASWLGRDAFSGEPVAQPAVGTLGKDELADVTAAPRRYGFHGTLKAPFRPAPGTGEAELVGGLQRIAPALDPVPALKLVVGRLGRFFALVPEGSGDELNRLAGDVVRAFEPFRAALTDDEVARRNPEKLTERQRQYLAEWGYPYVYDEFRFHMTLTGPVADADASRIEVALGEWFTPVLADPVSVSALSLFTEPAPGRPFTVMSSAPIGGAAIRKTG